MLFKRHICIGPKLWWTNVLSRVVVDKNVLYNNLWAATCHNYSPKILSCKKVPITKLWMLRTFYNCFCEKTCYIHIMESKMVLVMLDTILLDGKCCCFFLLLIKNMASYVHAYEKHSMRMFKRDLLCGCLWQSPRQMCPISFQMYSLMLDNNMLCMKFTNFLFFFSSLNPRYQDALRFGVVCVFRIDRLQCINYGSISLSNLYVLISPSLWTFLYHVVLCCMPMWKIRVITWCTLTHSLSTSVRFPSVQWLKP